MNDDDSNADYIKVAEAIKKSGRKTITSADVVYFLKVLYNNQKGLPSTNKIGRDILPEFRNKGILTDFDVGKSRRQRYEVNNEKLLSIYP